MKRFSLILLLVVIACLLVGCAASTMTSEKTLLDGTIVRYQIKVNSFGQDFKGSDLAASLDPEGKTTVKAGAVDTTTSQVTADVAKSMVELVEIMLPYVVPAPTPPVP